MTGATVETTHGPVAGVAEAGLHFFRGIPYAAPPVGDLRWLPPQPATPWREVRDGTAFGPACPQNPIVISTAEHLERVDGQRSEDCLYLNVCTPGLDDARRPVMVWIHGGGFVMGAGTMPLNDPRFLVARGDVVIVSLNYRMANFGFLRLEGITGGAIPASGNEGLLDQVAALEWVRDNIARFGGDPGNVTVFGQSAGAISIGMLLAMPTADGLLHRGILQSGACQTVQPADLADRIAAFALESAGVSPDDPGGHPCVTRRTAARGRGPHVQSGDRQPGTRPDALRAERGRQGHPAPAHRRRPRRRRRHGRHPGRLDAGRVQALRGDVRRSRVTWTTPPWWRPPRPSTDASRVGT